jgi:hypothetical protein
MISTGSPDRSALNVRRSAFGVHRRNEQSVRSSPILLVAPIELELPTLFFADER